MFARFVVPLFGSTPAVWNTSMLFFQTALLAGYLYAHATTVRLGVRRQAGLHLAVVLTALVVLPIAVPPGFAPSPDQPPALSLLALLAATVGLPFLVLSSTGPLLQRWLAGTHHVAGKDPYFLYRASNAGSMVGLLSYPLLLEPALRLADQGWAWTAGYAALVALTTACAVFLWRSSPAAGDGGRVWRSSPAAGDESVAHERSDAPVEESERSDTPVAESPWERRGPTPPDAPSWRRRAGWIGRAFVPSALVLGLTAYLTTDLAPIPLLWVVPLSLYLLSLVVAFSPGPSYERVHRAAVGAMPLAIVVLAVFILSDIQRPLWLVLAVHLTAFLVAAVACHGELARDRPAARHLTEFYLWVALGGALGGAFSALAAPLVFPGLVEYPLAIALVCLCGPNRARLPPGHFTRWLDLALPLALGLAVAGLISAGELAGPDRAGLVRSFAFGLAAGVCLTLARRPLRFGLAVGALLLAGALAGASAERVIFEDRTFFGIHRVLADERSAYRRLVHGTTTHGAQALSGGGPEPLTYYHRSGPVGQVFAAGLDPALTTRAAVLGLGTGAMACHARRGQHWTFYEIDPAVERIARDPRLFTYLRDCPAQADVVIGDARLSLARAPDRSFGLIVGDAFSSDAIPMHLLTREAMDLYLAKLADPGVLLFNLTNRYLDLAPALGELAQEAGLTCLHRVEGAREAAAVPGKAASHWMAMARRPDDLGRLSVAAGWQRCPGRPGESAFSDDYWNLVDLFRWG